MLDIETKRRIDTCRDILVGKVPDPKSQVEQITIALIYKFMDDMDQQSEEMGGKRSFFTKEFERYRWAKLVAQDVSGENMLNTYSEALTKMVQNEDLHVLFRDIFRNAYLPYRDSETLRAFLREIDSFTYDHSERLGDAFEYLLSVLGSQGDAGQFRTPRHIIDFMVEIVDPQKHEVIMDPACGTAGFLISAYKHILKQNTTHVVNGEGNDTETTVAEQALEGPMRYRGDLLKPEDRARLVRNIQGYDISPDMVRLSLANLFLHDFPNPKVEEYDTLTSEDKWNEVADVILANPPFMSPKGGIKPHARFQVQSKRSEVLFVDYIAEHLTPSGRAAIVVPEGIIFQRQNAYVELRKMLVKNYLAAVISVPAGVFNPYSGVKTSILILDRAVTKASQHVAFFKIENDGFALGAQRKAVEGSQLPQVRDELGGWLKSARKGGGKKLESSLGNLVERSEIFNDDDFNLSAERYQISKKLDTVFPLTPLGDLCELVRGVVYSRDDEVMSGGVPVLRATNIDKTTQSIVLKDVKLVYPKADFSETKKLKAGDIFICLSSSKHHVGKVAFVETDTEYYFGGFMGSIRCNTEKLHPKYLYWMLTESRFKHFLRQQISGATISNLGSALLYRYEIPLPSLELQRKIVNEIDGYQRVIDGARAVLDNYSPQVAVNPEWQTDELKNLIDTVKPPLKLKTSEYAKAGKIPIIDQSQDYIAGWTNNFDAAIDPQNGLVIFGDHTCTVKFIDRPFVQGADGIKILRARRGLLPKYLAIYLQAYPLAKDGYRRHFSKLKRHQVRFPELATQEAIVAEIEAERALINGNGDLITRFERKIDTAIARVWGTVKSEGSA